ncbi:MAG TPA: DUF4405 domain-containing protein, partial [Chitinophagaceae bacterium]|nr:DUF4405 domain-containing protein [Chitinophagaceae bacterium]
FIPIIVHLLIAWPWIQSSTRKFFKTPTRRTRFNFFLNAVLFILVITELISGFFISQVVLPNLGLKTINDSSWRTLHNETLNFTVLFAGLHVAVNWSWIVSIFKKRFTKLQSNKIFSPGIITMAFRICIVIIAAGIVASVLYSTLGPPSIERLYVQDEIARFRPTWGHGIVQLLGETSLIALYAFVARKWLRIKL